MATAAGRPPFWRDVRVLAWAFQIVVVAVVVAVVWYLYGNYVDNADANGQQHGVRVPRPAGGLPDPVELVPPVAADEGRHPRGLLQHAAPGDHGHRAGHGVRHADRRRPPVAELHPAQHGAGVRRDRPQRPAAGADLAGLHRRRPAGVPAAERLLDPRTGRRAQRARRERVLVRGRQLEGRGRRRPRPARHVRGRPLAARRPRPHGAPGPHGAVGHPRRARRRRARLDRPRPRRHEPGARRAAARSAASR